ncbi:MAG: dihydrofolate reductase [Actinomycetaceae bacterium]|nr:dihydrofolate reductase [Actinomycetaceae bacterium]
MIGMIWAEDRGKIIGAGGRMPWRIPADFRHFRETTMGHPIVMGAKSFLALGKPLAGRTNIVISRSRNFPGTVTARSLAQAIDQARSYPGGEEIWITGGGQVYATGMEIADRLAITHIDLDVSAKAAEMGEVVYAPAVDPHIWQMVSEDDEWRELSGDGRWRLVVWERRASK